MRRDTGGNGDRDMGSGRASARGCANVQPAGSSEARAERGGMLGWCVCFGKNTGSKVSVSVGNLVCFSLSFSFHIHTHTHTHIHTYTRTYTHTHTHTHTYTRTCTHAHPSIHTPTHTLTCAHHSPLTSASIRRRRRKTVAEVLKCSHSRPSTQTRSC